MKKISLRKFIPGIIWFVIVLIMICLPSYDIPNVNSWFHKLHADKWVHAGMFGILSFLFCTPFINPSFTSEEIHKYFIWISVSCSIWGLVTEIIQLGVPGRSFDLLDWAADSAGVVLVWAGLVWKGWRG